MLDFKFHQNRRKIFLSLRRVPPLESSIFYFKKGFLAIELSELPWQMVFLMNSECPNIYLPRKINRSHGIFCFIKKSYSTLWHQTKAEIILNSTLTWFVLNFFEKGRFSFFRTRIFGKKKIRTWNFQKKKKIQDPQIFFCHSS